MDISRRLLAAGLIALLSLFGVACNEDGEGGGDVEQELEGGEEQEEGEDD